MRNPFTPFPDGVYPFKKRNDEEFTDEEYDEEEE